MTFLPWAIVARNLPGFRSRFFVCEGMEVIGDLHSPYGYTLGYYFRAAVQLAVHYCVTGLYRIDGLSLAISCDKKGFAPGRS